MQKANVRILILAYVLLGGVISHIPTFAQSTDTEIIPFILEESKSHIEQQIVAFNENGIPTPLSVSELFEQGLIEHEAALEALNNGNLDAAKEHTLNALSMFEDVAEALYDETEDEIDDQIDDFNEINELAESIADFESRTAQLKEIAAANGFDINFNEFDEAINEAKALLANGNVEEADKQFELAEDLFDNIFNELDNEADLHQDERINEFVTNTIDTLNQLIANANELGLSQSIIDVLQQTIDSLQNLENTDDIINTFDESGDLNDLISESPQLVTLLNDIEEFEDDAEDEDDNEDEVEDDDEVEDEDKVEDEDEDEAEDDVEDDADEDFEDNVEDEAEDDVEDDADEDFEDNVEDDVDDDIDDDSSGSSDDDDSSGSSDDDDSSGSSDDDDSSGSSGDD